MSVSRRQFFKGLGATIGMVGLHGFLKGEIAYAQEKKPPLEKVRSVSHGSDTAVFSSHL